jgi:hypothetical protein
VDGWVGGWIGVKAVLRIAYSNQKLYAFFTFPGQDLNRGSTRPQTYVLPTQPHRPGINFSLKIGFIKKEVNAKPKRFVLY